MDEMFPLSGVSTETLKACLREPHRSGTFKEHIRNREEKEAIRDELATREVMIRYERKDQIGMTDAELKSESLEMLTALERVVSASHTSWKPRTYRGHPTKHLKYLASQLFAIRAEIRRRKESA